MKQWRQKLWCRLCPFHTTILPNYKKLPDLHTHTHTHLTCLHEWKYVSFGVCLNTKRTISTLASFCSPCLAGCPVPIGHAGTRHSVCSSRRSNKPPWRVNKSTSAAAVALYNQTVFLHDCTADTSGYSVYSIYSVYLTILASSVALRDLSTIL